MGLFGQAQPRIEDEPLIRGRGQYIDDIQIAGALAVVLVRSQMAHARIGGVDVAAARAAPGVVAVLSAADLPETARILPDCHPNPILADPKGCPALAAGKVRYVGEPVAAVVAENRYLAEDAAELVEVDYLPLPAVVDLEAAVAPGATRVHDDLRDNVATTIPVAKGDTAAAFRDAACLVEGRFEIHRGAGQAMETRGVIAHNANGRLQVWSTSQVPYVVRDAIANALALPKTQVQVLSPDVGGGFGYKGFVYVEDILIPTLSRLLDRPLKWIEDRREHLIAAYQERSQLHVAALATDADGRILGLRDRFLHDAGAYSPWGPVIPLLTAVNVPGPYKVPACEIEGRMVYTTCVPVAPVRGAGRPQAVFVIESLLDRAAAKLGLDRVEIRRRNLIQADEYPYDVGFKSRDGSARYYDSGDIPTLLRKALELTRYDAHRIEQAAARAQGRRIGLGVACAVEESGLGPFEEAAVELRGDGTLLVRAGTPSQGQGQRTILAQIVADLFDVGFDQVEVRLGDTDLVRDSIGTYASRVAVVTGSAVQMAAREVGDKVLTVAAQLLQSEPPAVRFCGGRVVVADDPQRSVTLAAIAEAGPIVSTQVFRPETMTYPTGAHVAVVEVDDETGQVTVLDYAAAQDFGIMINPMIVDGQVIGAFAHGIGNALLERVRYDADGQIVTGTFADYLLPTATDVPVLQRAYIECPTPLNPLGAKGAGQGGCIPVPSAIRAAVEDALSDLGVRIERVPFSQAELLALIDAARAGATA